MGIVVAIVDVGCTGDCSFLAVAIVAIATVLLWWPHVGGVAIVCASVIAIVLGHPGLLAIVASVLPLLRDRRRNWII